MDSQIFIKIVSEKIVNDFFEKYVACKDYRTKSCFKLFLQKEKED